MIQKILFPFRVLDWLLVQTYRGLGLLAVFPLRWLLSVTIFISESKALFLAIVLLISPLFLGYRVPYSWNFVIGVVFALFVLKQSEKVQKSMHSLLAKMTAHFKGIVPPHFNKVALDESKPQAFNIPDNGELKPPPPIGALSGYGIASQAPNESVANDIVERLPPALRQFATPRPKPPPAA